MEFFNQTSEETLQALQADKTNGLTPEKVRESAEKFGRNEFTKAGRKSLLRRIWEASTEPMLILLFFAWIITIAVNSVSAAKGGHFDVYECIGIFVAIIISVVLTIVMEGSVPKLSTLSTRSKTGSRSK